MNDTNADSLRALSSDFGGLIILIELSFTIGQFSFAARALGSK